MTLVRRGALGVLAATGVVAALIGVAFTGVATAVTLGDPGALVRWGLPAVETLTELAASLTVGALLLAVCVLPRRGAAPARTGTTPPAAPGTTAPRAAADGAAYPRSLVLAGAAAGAWTVLSVVHLVLAYASVAGTSPLAPSFGDELALFVTQIDLGRTLLSVTTVAAVVTALALVVATPTGAAWTSALALVALWQLGQTGHAAGAASHDLATSAMVLHLVSAAVWIGALAALAVLVGRLGSDVVPAVARYSAVAGWCVAGVAISGVVNSAVRLGGWDGLATTYGALLVTKVVLFGAMALLGLAHRRVTIPGLAGPRGRALFWRVVLVELAVMGAVSGVAVALGSSPPPVPDTPVADTSPAYVLTGHPLPPEPTALRWLTEWRWDVLMACAAAAGVVVYLRWVRRLRRRGDAWPWLRTASWLVGMVVFAWTTSGGPAVYGHVLFSAHMIQHMVLVMVVPMFVALSAPVTLALRALPARAGTLRGDTSRGPREWVLVLVHSRVGRFLAHPVVAAVNFAGSMVLFYYSGLFEWTLRSGVGHLAMVVHFSVAGYLFVNALAGIDPGPTRPPYPMRLLLLFATMAFHAFFGVALVDGQSLLVADWFGLTGREWGPSAIRDQQIGGSIAWGIGEIPTLALAVVVAVQWTRDDERTARRRDRRADRDGDAELDEYNAMLGRLAQRDAGA